MPDYRNPAERLVDATRRLQGVPVNKSLRDAIETAFGIQGDGAVLAVAADLIELPNLTAVRLEAEAESANLADSRLALYLKWRDHYSQAFQQIWALENPLANMLQRITGEDTTALESAAGWLEDRTTGRAVDDADLEALHAQAQDLATSIVDSTQLPDELKLALLDQLDKIVRALRHARIAGPTVLTDASDETLGALIRDLGHRAKGSEEGSNILRRILAFLNAVNLLVTVTTGVTALPAHINTFFGLIDGENPAIEG